jgi:hypothetical protein
MSNNLTSDKEKKEYIKKTWNVSSGKIISEMLKRYWKIGNPKPSLLDQTKEVFGVKD